MTQADRVLSTPPTDTSALTLLTRLRCEAEAEIERLLKFLDELDGDPDLEPAVDAEPDLGSVDGSKRPFDQSAWSVGQDGEHSLGSDEKHPDGMRGGWSCDGRPWRDTDGSQQFWGVRGNRDDREESEDVTEADLHDGREPDVDDELSGDEEEPMLGSFDRLLNQNHGWRQTAGDRTWWLHNNSDAECDPS